MEQTTDNTKRLKLIIGLLILLILAASSVLIPALIKQRQKTKTAVSPTAPTDSRAWITPGQWGFRIGGAIIRLGEDPSVTFVKVTPLMINESSEPITVTSIKVEIPELNLSNSNHVCILGSKIYPLSIFPASAVRSAHSRNCQRKDRE